MMLRYTRGVVTVAAPGIDSGGAATSAKPTRSRRAPRSLLSRSGLEMASSARPVRAAS